MIFTENKVKNTGLVERNLLSLSYGKLKRKDIDNATGLVPESFEGYQIIEEGYIILRFTDLQNDKKSLRVGYCPERGIITNAYVGIVPNEDIHSKYFYYQLHFLDTIKYFYNLGGGVRQSLSYKEFKRETLLVPEAEEQIKIAAFLDYKLAKINRFIQKKKQLIKLLTEQKVATINQAITKGTNLESATYGIENLWIDELPVGFNLEGFNKNVFLKHGFQFREEHFSQEGIKVVKITQLSPDGSLRLENASFVPEHYQYDFKNIIIEDNDVLMALTGGTIGKIIRANINGEILLQNYRVGNFYPINDKLSKDFLYWQLKSEFIQAQMKFYVRETGQPNIGKGDFRKIQLIIPPIDEQEKIVEIIVQETDKIDTTISKIEKEIALTQEYKTAIIAEAVTGKIDIRDFKIPDSTEEENYEELEEELSLAAEDEAEYQTEEIEE
ncbi:restriction endonuclease subunit S [Litoribaculum gwangyangense]